MLSQWWCAATGRPWTWAWQAYPGAWLCVVAAIAFGVTLQRRAVRRGQDVPAGAAAWYGAGVLAAWLSVDWPLGPLGAGYLASAHTVSYILLTMVSAPCLLLGMRGWLVPVVGWRRQLANPFVGALLYHVGLFATHAPAVADRALVSPLGSFAIDATWLLAGMGLWWPVLAPEGEGWMRRPLVMLYLFAMTILPTIPAALMTFADYPGYRVYEAAPRALGLDAVSDQQLAGLLMKLGADPFIILALGITFVQWQREERAADALEANARPRR